MTKPALHMHHKNGYSQLEKELLFIVFGCRCLDDYIYSTSENRSQASGIKFSKENMSTHSSTENDSALPKICSKGHIQIWKRSTHGRHPFKIILKRVWKPTLG